MASIAVVSQPVNVYQRGEDTYGNAAGATCSMYLDSAGNIFFLVQTIAGTPVWYQLTLP